MTFKSSQPDLLENFMTDFKTGISGRKCESMYNNQ